MRAVGNATDRATATDVYTDWQDVYRDNVSGIYRLIYARVGNRSDAEDLTAEAFMATLKPLRLPAPRRDVRAYLVATARTVLASFWRRFYSAPPALPASDTLPANEEQLDPQAGVAQATAILSRLPERSRTILELRFLRGYSIREAAVEMAVSIPNAKVLQYRALRLAASLGGRIQAEAELLDQPCPTLTANRVLHAHPGRSQASA
jgi:RNA polymerase sigma-70 factor, ECF subfamily